MTTFSHDEIEQLAQQFETMYPQEILTWAAETFGSKLALVTSFQPTGLVTLHMMHTIAPDVPVLTIDTDLLFPETYRLIDEVADRFKLNLVRVKPTLSLAQQAQCCGENLWETNPNECCNMRKVAPLGMALAGFDAWITGVRRDQSPTRGNTPGISWDRRYLMIKLCPFATWTEEMIWTYVQAHDLPYNELHDRHYPSIGCWPCTQPVDDEHGYNRDGRWAGHHKTECGLHAPPEESPEQTRV